MLTKKTALPAAALALTGAAALLVPNALCGDESAHDAVERLMPQLLSEDAGTRADAEKRVLALGDAGRAELERITRETDTRRAVTALRLLQSPKWGKGGKAGGEERVHKDGEDARTADDDDPSDRSADIESRRAQIERQMDELRRRFRQFDRGFTLRGPDFDFKGGTRGSSSGTVVENDRTTRWTVEADGRIKVTLKDGKDAAEQTFEAKSMDELRKEHPDVAKRIEPLMGRADGGFSLRFGGRDRGPTKDFDVDPFGFDATPQTPVLGIGWSPVPDVLREQLDLGAGGMVVENVVPESLAEKLGLVRYDVIVEVQGKPVAGSPDVRAALEGAKAGDKVTAVVVRKGKRQTLETTK